MDLPKPIEAKLVISGVFEYRDAQGVLLKTVEMRAEVPVPLDSIPVAEVTNERSE